MLKLTSETMAKAIERAKAVHPKVKVISASERTYRVSGSKGGEYTVRFSVANGHKLAECECPARGVCFHIAAAYEANVLCQSFRTRGTHAEPTLGRMQMFTARNTGWMV